MKTGTKNVLLFLAIVLSLVISAIAERPELKSPKVILNPGPEYADEVRMFQGIASLGRAPNGRLWAVWYSGGITEEKQNYVMVVTSGDDGKTWTKPHMVIKPIPEDIRTFDAVPWLDPNGRFWIFWAQAMETMVGDQRIINAHVATWAITTDNADDENPTWSKPRRLFDGLMMNKPTAAADGSWLFPTAFWGHKNSCRIHRSTDQGWSFEEYGAANVVNPKDRACDEPMIVQRPNDLWLLVRTAYGIGESTSTDGGKTWSDVTPTGIAHPSARFFIRRLNSGNLLMVKHGPLKEKIGRSHITAYLSKDEGKTWEGGLLLAEHGCISYPDGDQAPDGTIYMIHDKNRSTTKQIFMSTFTEADVLAGKDVSGKVRLEVLINQATGVRPPEEPTFNKNADGVPLKASAQATLVADSPKVAKGTLIPSAKLFTNRNYSLQSIPEPLFGKQFFLTDIEGGEYRCTKPGTVWVITSAKVRNPESLEEKVKELGFQKVALEEFSFFRGPGDTYNVCTVYQKDLKKGDVLKLGKWGIVAF